MTIRNMNEKDAPQVLSMMAVFYASEEVYTNGSEAIFQQDVAACLSGEPFLEGYILEEKGALAGYAMVAKSFSTEFGKPCIWVEDLYVREVYRGLGFGSAFLAFLADKYPRAVIRLEVEKENERAVHVYHKAGFTVLPYMEMIKR